MVGVQKRKIQWAISLLLVMLYFSGLPAQAQYGGGSGTAGDPYLIYTAEQMNEIGLHEEDWDNHFKLMADIDLSAYTGTEFNIIGYYRDWDFDRRPFTGVFDGNGHTISNFTYTTSEREDVGIFGVAHNPARIESLGLINPNVDAGWWTGALVGALRYGTKGTIGTITNCYVVGGRVAGGYHVGGLVGISHGTFTITNCYSSCSVWGHWAVGGLVGQNWQTITNCYATGDVTGQEKVGGLVGGENGTITNCYSTGSVSGIEEVGGLVGANWGDGIRNSYSLGNVSGNTEVGGLAGSNYGTITNCYDTGDVTGQDKVGGLVGLNGLDDYYAGKITNCYSVGSVTGTIEVGGLVGSNDNMVYTSLWDTETSGQSNSDGGMGKTTAEMQTESTFTDAGWDFVAESVNGTEDTWCICEGADYPKLAWQFVIGDFDGDDDTDLADFAIFAARWLQTDSSFLCGGGGTDLTNDGEVDFDDLKEFAENWLAGIRSD